MRNTMKKIYIFLLFVAIAKILHATPSHTEFINKLIDSSAYNYRFGYAPSIVYYNKKFHVFFCSLGKDLNGNGVDVIRYAWSNDGRKWSTPTQVVGVSNTTIERNACDPSVVRYQAPGDSQPYYYLFYSGTGIDIQTLMFVARSKSINGPYAKWTKNNTWQINAHNPKPIIYPANPKPDTEAEKWYGAGQQTVVVLNNKLYSWYSDTTKQPAPGWQIFMRTATVPTEWSAPQGTNIVNPSVEVKYDDRKKQFLMYYIEYDHHPLSSLVQRYSYDGLNWYPSEIVCNSDCFPHYSHNVGISGDAYGHIIGSTTLAMYGAPHNLFYKNCSLIDVRCKEQWDLYGTVINSKGAVWNAIPWGDTKLPRSGKGQYIPASGDYDGNGKIDPTLVNLETGQ